MLMVKPALAYLDVIREVRKASNLPLAAYNVSGEYSMVHAAAAAKMIDLDRAMMEVLTSIRRAGADVIPDLPRARGRGALECVSERRGRRWPRSSRSGRRGVKTTSAIPARRPGG